MLCFPLKISDERQDDANRFEAMCVLPGVDDSRYCCCCCCYGCFVVVAVVLFLNRYRPYQIIESVKQRNGRRIPGTQAQRDSRTAGNDKVMVSSRA